MCRLMRRIRYWLSRNRMDAELAEEMEHHRAMLRESGAKASTMGNAALAREEARGVWIWPWIESMWQDGLHALRGMRREPGFTITALLALGSAIGINTSLFTIFNALALRPWPVREPSQGFDVQNTTTLALDLPASGYTGPRTKTLTLDLLAQLNGSADLPVWGMAMNPPLSNANYSISFQPPGFLVGQIYFNEISTGYIGALGMHLLAGRNFVPEDGGRDVMMINQAAAKRWWPDESAVGKTVFANDAEREIVGVISDTYSNDLSSIEAVLYFPISGTHGAPFLIVHDRDTASVDRISALVKQIEPRAQVRAEPLSIGFRRKLEPSIHGSEIAGMLGLLAMAIAAVGMFGVFAYVVSQRTREIGVRMALGAQPVRIIWLVLGSSLGALATGLGCGMVCAAAISAFLAHALPGIVPLDPLAYSTVLILLGAAVAVASAVPARRATRVDPARALAWE